MTTPAERVAILTAMQAGITAELGRAKTEALAVAETVGVQAFATPWGRVNVQHGEPKVRFLDDELLAWCQEHAPTEVETRRYVRSSYQTALGKRLVVVAGEVLDTQTGEVVPFAVATPPGADYITFPASQQQKAAKTAAIAWIAEHSDVLVQGLAAIFDADLDGAP